MHPVSGNDLKTFLLHRTAFLCISRFLRLDSFGTVNALMIVISVTFQPLFSVIPEIQCIFVGRRLHSTIFQEPECCLGKGFLGGYMVFHHLYKGVMLKLAAYAHEIVIGIVARAVYAESDARF